MIEQPNKIRQAAQWLVHTNLWVGLAVAGFSYWSFQESFRLMGLFYSLFLLLGTASAYSYMRWVKLVQGGNLNDSAKRGWYQNDILALTFTLSSGIIALSFLKIIFTWTLFWGLLPSLFISLIYPLAFPFPNRYFSSLRGIPMLKLLIIAASWAWLSYGLPVLISQEWLGVPEILELLFRIILVVGLTLPFDIRDLDKDKPGLKTIPQLLGIQSSVHLAVFALVLYQIWMVIAYFLHYQSLPNALGWLLALELGIWLIKALPKQREREFYISFWLEGIPLYGFLLIALLQQAFGNSYF